MRVSPPGIAVAVLPPFVAEVVRTISVYELKVPTGLVALVLVVTTAVALLAGLKDALELSGKWHVNPTALQRLHVGLPSSHFTFRRLSPTGQQREHLVRKQLGN